MSVAADNLRRMADVVERERFGAAEWVASVDGCRAVSPVETPAEIARAAAAVRGRDLCCEHLAAMLRGVASELD